MGLLQGIQRIWTRERVGVKTGKDAERATEEMQRIALFPCDPPTQHPEWSRAKLLSSIVREDQIKDAGGNPIPIDESKVYGYVGQIGDAPVWGWDGFSPKTQGRGAPTAHAAALRLIDAVTRFS